MKVSLWAMGAASDDWVKTGEQLYQKRIERYMPFEYACFQPSKSKVKEQVLAEEGKWMLQQLESKATCLILLDERGTQFTSVQLASKLEQWRQGTYKRVVFLIGSAYGFSQPVYTAAQEKMALSKMTLPHQLCRLLMLEQLYRACTIQKGESYHHE
jgi:23S rRNA (pseudouridine1915-N3)-methyltransferase